MSRLFNTRLPWYGLILLSAIGVIAILLGFWEMAAILGFGALVLVGTLHYATHRRSGRLLRRMRTVRNRVEAQEQSHRQRLVKLMDSTEKHAERQTLASETLVRFAAVQEADIRALSEELDRRITDLQELHQAASRKQLALLRELYATGGGANTEGSRAEEQLEVLQQKLGGLVQKELQTQAAAVRRTEFRLERAERKVLGALETERMQSLEHQTHVDEALNELTDRSVGLHSFLEGWNREPAAELFAAEKRIEHQLITLHQRLSRQTMQASRETVRHVEALLQLLPKVSSRAPLPTSGGFAMDARALLHLSAIIAEYKPQKILELGGGTSTIWMGYLTEEFGTEIISIDHLEEYGSATAASVERHSFTNRIECRVAPLAKVSVEGNDYQWYSLDALRDIGGIDLLLVDGPPEATGVSARYPAFPLLAEKLTPRAVVLLDDTHREAEQKILAGWERASGGKREIRDQNVSRLGVLARQDAL